MKKPAIQVSQSSCVKACVASIVTQLCNIRNSVFQTPSLEGSLCLHGKNSLQNGQLERLDSSSAV